MNKSLQHILISLSLFFLFFMSIITLGCQDSELRGSVVKSADEQTYLVADNNGRNCGAIMIDGEKWSYPLHKPGLIEPGVHIISCGG